MKHAPDMVHPLLDEYACQYFERLPQSLWPRIGVTAHGPRGTWWTIAPELRAQFREIAGRFMDGDETLAIWRLTQASDSPGLLG